MKSDAEIRKPLALYIHIPFCVRKCLYCDFLSAPAEEQTKEHYIDRIVEDIRYYGELYKKEYEVTSVFIGGGTPSCLSEAMLVKLGHAVREAFLKHSSSDGSVEYTIEVNPGTVTGEKVNAIKEMGANRISIGLQSADNGELQALGRIHTYEDFLESYRIFREQGFENIGVDLMADIPGQTFSGYQETLKKVCSLSPEHISGYSLIVEEGTPFYEMQERGELIIPDEETDRQMYEETGRYLKNQGYERYEISNYAKKGRECRHNLTYWELGDYLGIGLGAASLIGHERRRNETDLESYLSQRPDMQIFTESHVLSVKEQMEEYMFLGLRKMEGISVLDFQKRFGIALFFLYGDILPKLFSRGLLAETKNRDRIYLTKKGIDVSNVVLAEFLL